MVNMRTLAASVSSTAITTHQSATLSYGAGQQALFSSSSASDRCTSLLGPNTTARYLSNLSPCTGKLTLPAGGKTAAIGGSAGTNPTNSNCGVERVANSGSILSGDLSVSSDVGTDLSGVMEDWRLLESGSLLGGGSLTSGLGGPGLSDGGAGVPGLQDIIEASVSPSSNAAVASILDQVHQLTELQRLLLYIRLPTTATTTTGAPLPQGCPGGGSGGGGVLAGVGGSQQPPPPSSMLADALKHPSNPLGSRAEIQLTITWIRTHLTLDTEVSMPKREVYNEYMQFCAANSSKPLSTADFGKVMKQVFPNVRPRRLGQRGASKYCYSGLRKTDSLARPHVPDLFEDEDTEGGQGAKTEDTKCWWSSGGNNNNFNTNSSLPGKATPLASSTSNNSAGNNNNSGLNHSAQIVVLEWAEKLLCNNNKNNTSSVSNTSNSNNKNGVRTGGGCGAIKMEGSSSAADNINKNDNNTLDCAGGGVGNHNTNATVGKRGRCFGSSTNSDNTTTRDDAEDSTAALDDCPGGGVGEFGSLVELAAHLVAEKLVNARSHHATVVTRSCAGEDTWRKLDQLRRPGHTSPPAPPPTARQRDTVTLQLQRKLQERDQKRKLQDTSSSASSASSVRGGGAPSSLPLVDKQQKMRRRSTSTSGGAPPALIPLPPSSSCTSSGVSSACSSNNSSRNPSGDSVASNSSGVSSLSSCSSLNTIQPNSGALFPPSAPYLSQTSHGDVKDVKPNVVTEFLSEGTSLNKALTGCSSQQPVPHTKTMATSNKMAPLQQCMVGSVITTSSSGCGRSAAGNSSDTMQGKWAGQTAPGQLARIFTQKSLVILPSQNTMSVATSSGSSSVDVASASNGKISSSKLLASDAGGVNNTASKLLLGTTRYKNIHPKLTATTNLQGSTQSSFGPSTSNAGGVAPKGKTSNTNMQEFTAADIDSLMNQGSSANLNLASSKNVACNSSTVSTSISSSKFSATFSAVAPVSRSSCAAGTSSRMLASGSIVADNSCVSSNTFLQASLQGQAPSTNFTSGLVRSESYSKEDDEAKTPDDENIKHLRNFLLPIVGPGQSDASQKSGAVCSGFFTAHDKNTSVSSESCGMTTRCDFTPIQSTGTSGMMAGGSVNPNRHITSNCGTANTSANASPFTSPQMTPQLSRSRHNSGQTSSTYLTPRSTPFNPDDNLNVSGYSTNSTANTTPFMSPVMTPQFSRSRHNSQNHRMHAMAPGGCSSQMSQLHPGTTIGPPSMGSSGLCGSGTGMVGTGCSMGTVGSRSRHSSGARRFPYSVPEDHAQHQSHYAYLPPSHHHRVQQRRLRNSSGGGIPPSPHSAPLSPLIDGQEFYSSGPMSQPGGGGNISSDYRRRHTSAGPLIHNHHPAPMPLNQNQMLSALSSNQHQMAQLNPNSRLHNLPNMSALQLSPLNEPSAAGQTNNMAPDQSNLSNNRPQSVPLPEMLCNQQYSLSVPSTPLLHPNQQPLSHNQQSLAQGGLTTDNIINHNLAHGCYSNSGFPSHFSFDASLPPSCTPTPVPSEYADFNSESCLDGITGLDTLDSLDPIEPMSQSTPPNVSPFRDRSNYQCSNSNSISNNVCGSDNNTMTYAGTGILPTSSSNNNTSNNNGGSCGNGFSSGLTTTSSYCSGPNPDRNPTLGSVTCPDPDTYDGNTGLDAAVFDGNFGSTVGFGSDATVGVPSSGNNSGTRDCSGSAGDVFARDFAAATAAIVDRNEVTNDNSNANTRNPFISGNTYNIFSNSDNHTNNTTIQASSASGSVYDNNRSHVFNGNINNNDDGGNSMSNSNSGGLFSPSGGSGGNNMNHHHNGALDTPFSPDNQTCHSFQVSGQSGSSEITLNALNTSILSNHTHSGSTAATGTLSNNNNNLDTSGGLGLSSSVSDIGDGFGSLDDVFQLGSGGLDL